LEAAKLAVASSDRSALVTAALGAGGIWVYEEREVIARAALKTLWDGASAVALPHSPEKARLAVRQTAEAAYEGGSVEEVAVAVEQVRGFRDDAATAEALSLLHHVQLGPRYAEARLGLAQEVIALGARAQDTFLSLTGLCWRTIDLFLLGDPRAGQSLEELRERSAAEPCEALGFIADVLGAMTIARSGRFEDAEAASTAAARRGSAVGDPDAPAFFAAMLAALRWWQGREEEIIDLVRDISTSPRLGFNDHVYVAANALLSAALGDVDAAEEALARLNGAGLETLPHSSSWLTTLFLAAEAAYVIGDAQTATAAGSLLAPYAHLPVMPSLAVVCLGSAERALGLCAATTGRVDAAVHHLDAAIRADHRLGSRPMAIVTEHTLAGILSARARPGDAPRAEQLARRASDRAKRIGVVLRDHPDWLTTSELAVRAASDCREARLQSCPGGWKIVVDGRATVLPDRVGFRYLAELVSRPGQGCDVLELATSGLFGSSLADPVADQQALASYRRRARQLAQLIASEDVSSQYADRYRKELTELTRALRSTIGLSGRTRVFPDNDERARTAVRKALMRAIDSIEAAEAELGCHLRSSVVTGIACCYSPTPGWDVKVQRDGPIESLSQNWAGASPNMGTGRR
jgi:tetratricopeptide (TPR) repeat protein